MKQDVSKGVDPVQSHYDIFKDEVLFRIDGKTYRWDTRKLPFTLKAVIIGGIPAHCADKALILRHANG